MIRSAALRWTEVARKSISEESLNAAASLESIEVHHVIAGIGNRDAGTTSAVLRLCSELSGIGVPTVLHTLLPAPQDAVPLAVCRYYAVVPGWPARLGVSPALRQGLRQLASSARLIHNHGLWMMPNYYAGEAARIGGGRYVLGPHGMLSAWALRRSRWRKRLLWWFGHRAMLERVDLFHATAASEALDIRRLGFRQPIAVIPYGVDIPESPRARPQSSRRRLVFLGRVHPVKGVELLIRAWPGLAARFPDWDLVIAGPDEIGYRSAMQKLAESLRAPRVVWPGPMRGGAKRDLFFDADLLVLPSHSENFGMVVAEALAHGVPVVTTRGTPWEELPVRGCGWWIDQPRLAEALAEAMSLPAEARAAMGARGRAWVERVFAWPTVAHNMLAAYEWLLDRRSAPPTAVITG